MDKLGGALMTLVGIGVIMIGFRTGWDQLYTVMNETKTLTNIESLVWQFAPIAIPVAAVVGGIIVLSRRNDKRRDDNRTEW